ncbi:MAG: single-stranded DNA-binding protein [Phycisphaerae bacterium]|jgi:single-strand DNA-binding protein
MANYNKVLLIGNLTRDPQLSYLPSQTAVVDFGIAVNRRWTGKDGQAKESTCFVDCRAFAGQAETINKYLTKGRPIFVEGRLDYDTWTAQDGTKRSKHRITVESFQFLGSPGGGAGGGNRGGRDNESGGGQNVPEAGPAAGPDDDIPF